MSNIGNPPRYKGRGAIVHGSRSSEGGLRNITMNNNPAAVQQAQSQHQSQMTASGSPTGSETAPHLHAQRQNSAAMAARQGSGGGSVSVDEITRLMMGAELPGKGADPHNSPAAM